MTPTVLSLFSGIGGLDLGLERAGWQIVGQVENDPWCQRVLAKHWPKVLRWGDIREVNPDDLPRADLIAGGFPCQPVSSAGKRLGQQDERWLWPEAARLVRGLRPRWVLLENVPGLLARGMGDVLGELAACGYDAEWDCIPAAAIGAPHQRDRVWIVAYPQGQPRALRPAEGERLGRPSSGSADASDPECEQLRDEPGRRDGQGGPGASIAGDDGPEGHVEDPDSIAVGQGRRRRGTPEAGELADPNGEGRWQRRWLGGPGPTAVGDGWWAAEPDVGRVAARISTGLDGGLDAHPGCLTQARTAGLPKTGRLQALWRYLATPAASSEPARCGICGHPLSALPCRGACSPWYLGAGIEEAEDLRCLREGLLGLLTHSGEVLLTRVPDGAWQGERSQAVGSRLDRLRGLGNAVVPQVAELIGRRILAAHLGQVVA